MNCWVVAGNIDSLINLNNTNLTNFPQLDLISKVYPRIVLWIAGRLDMVRKSVFRDVKGSIPVIFALSAVPLLLASGAAIDMVQANNAKTALQAEVDAAALAGGTSKITNQSQLRTLVRKYLASNDAHDFVTYNDANITFGTIATSGNFFVKVKGKMQTSFMGMAGYSTLDIDAYTEVEKGSNALELALVLDNTASMNSEGRMEALKVSAKNLVSTVLDSVPAGAYVKIGIVPFSNYVNVGLPNRNKSWLDVPPDSVSPIAQTYPTYPNATYSNCHLTDHPYLNDGVPAVWQSNDCDVNQGTPVMVTYYPSSTWNGCVGSRNNGLDTKINGLANKYPGIMDMNCAAPITDLTPSKATLDSQIDAMIATGETYIPSGLLWGWNMLDSNEPITGAKTKAEMVLLKGTKSLVLMTDGDNTLSASYPRHDGSDAAAADAKTAELCSKIKADGISVYTVGFKVTKPSSISLLAECASSPSQAFAAADASALAAVFSEIAGSLAQVRVAK